MKKAFNPLWRKRVAAICVTCGSAFQAVESEIRRGKGRCCSRSCATALASVHRDQAGAANNNWRGGSGNSERKRRYRERNPAKHAAHLALTRAIRSGVLVRQSCEQCGAERVEGHHDDYDKPLEVRWLCKRRHLAAHGGRLDNRL